MKLIIKGDVGKFVLLEPEIISLKGKAGESIAAQMKITPTIAEEFNILKTFAKNGKNITFSLEKIKKEAGVYFVFSKSPL